ncbi:MAG TPA: carboxymuconolactone decarboxylase family protein [Acidimicrobiales bacterium]|nr:carboxymuconolactone decarboxylase family protein [Acidimicrobiales bacterium]
MTHAHEVLDELREPGHVLRRLIPDVYAAFGALDRAAMAEGVLSAKQKELIALAIGATRECDACIASHARGAARAGATEAEVAEAMAVTILMNGGPGTVWGPRALDAFREYASGST